MAYLFQKRNLVFSGILAFFLSFSLVFFSLVKTVSAQSVVFDIGQPSMSTFYGAFQGFGAEWDPFYWNENNRRRGTDEAGWELITNRLKELNIGIVRLMMQLYWAQNSPDLTNWTWNTSQMQSVFKYLDFCQENNIDVILTDWGWAVRGQMYSNPTDYRYAQGVAEYLKEFIDRRGYTRIKYLVVGNEPDNEIEKDYGMDAYEAMYRNIDRALRENGMRGKIKLVGPDMGGTWDFMKEGIDRLKDILDNYDFHRYATLGETSNEGLPGTWESLWYHLDLWRGEVLSRDPQGANKYLLLTEMGNAGGGTNSHPLIDTFDYALHMADYGTTLLTTRLQAGIAWSMHDIYYFDGSQFMQWGMWKYLDDGWELRPWSQSFGLLIKHAPRGSLQAPVNNTPPQTPPLSPYRSGAVKRPDGGWSIFLVNRTNKSVSVNVRLPETPSNSFDRYQFDRNSIVTYPNIIALPPIGTVPGANNINLALPGESFVVLSETKQATTPTPTSSCARSGDVDCDGRVDKDDVLAILRNWLLSSPNPSRADTNGDGKVNGVDFGYVVRDWGG